MNPYALLGGFCVALALTLGGYFYGIHHQSVIDRLAIADQKAEAAQMLATETAKVLDKERENAALNAQLEKERADAQAQHVADNTNLRDAMATWMRTHPGCRQSSSGPAGQGAGAAVAPDAAAGSVEQLPAGSGAFIQRAAAAADTVSAYARECHAFVTSLEK